MCVVRNIPELCLIRNDADPDESEVALQHIGMAIPIHVNFGISRMEGVVREVRAALQRRKKEVLLA
jgi:hypothetical protein